MMRRSALRRVAGLLAVAWLGSLALGISPVLAARWVRQTVSTISGNKDNWLFGVSCSSTQACMAVGWSIHENNLLTFTEQWDGSAWTVIPSANGPSGQNRLLNVSCSAPTRCIAVGEDVRSDGVTRRQIQMWDGSSWQIQDSPAPRGAVDSSLSAVSCPSARSCTAVGSWDRGGGGGGRALIEHWDGSAWRVQRAPRGGPLSGVSCTSARFCLAIGSQLERWDGHRWTVLRALRFGGWTAISCSSSRGCMAVGNKLRSLLWTGSRVITEPVRTGHEALYSGVSCVSARNCTAVGSSSIFSTRAARWNGVRWVFQRTPSPAPRHSLLGSVSCPTRGMCIAVGLAGPAPLVEQRS